jgi:hypothetical protein
MQVHLPSPDELAINDLEPETLARALKASQEGIQALQHLQRHAFAATFVRFFHAHPDAILYINGQTGEYTDEGYSGCFVSRVDAPYVRERAATTTQEKDYYYSRELASNKSFNQDVLRFRESSGGYSEKTHDVLPNGIRGLTQPEFYPFGELSGLEESWRDIADFNGSPSDGGMVYAKSDLRELVSHLGGNLQELTAMIESQALNQHVAEKGVDVKRKRGRPPKAL